MTPPRPRTGQAIAAALALWLVLILPSAAGEMRRWLALLPPELPLILLLLMAAGPGRAGLALRAVLTAVLTLVSVLKLADLAMAEVLGRRFNPVGDLALIDASARMIAGSLGPAAAIGAALACLTLVAALAMLLWWASGVWSRMPSPRPAIALTAAALSLAALIAAPTGTAIYTVEKTALARRAWSDLADFRQMARDDKASGQVGALAAIDRDVLVIFIESYGRTSFDTGFYADKHLATLREAERDLQAAGLALRSGFLTAPTQGGQSWLSHASFASGLWVDDQSRYQALLASGRRTLFDVARDAGFLTAAVMPAITRPWPEASRMGFERVLTAGDLGYRGKPFNWVTMPDQFTLAATDRLLREAETKPVFAQVALISSHAPWVPVPRLVGWDEIGDGRVFDAMAEAGPTPKQVWADYDDVRLHYRATIDYALRAVAAYARLHADNPPLLIVLGDHQAAARIALDERREVPIHLIGPRDLVERSRDWGFAPGLIPPPGSRALPMDQLRDLILRGFGGPDTAGLTTHG